MKMEGRKTNKKQYKFYVPNAELKKLKKREEEKSEKSLA